MTLDKATQKLREELKKETQSNKIKDALLRLQESCPHDIFATFYLGEVNDSSASYACPLCGLTGSAREGFLGIDIGHREKTWIDNELFEKTFPYGKLALLEDNEIEKLKKEAEQGPEYSVEILSVKNE